MSRANFAVKYTAEKPKVYEIHTTPTSGKKAYYFLLVEAYKCEELEQKLFLNGKMSLPDYGTIIASGFGAPNDELREELKARFKVVTA